MRIFICNDDVNIIHINRFLANEQQLNLMKKLTNELNIKEYIVDDGILTEKVLKFTGTLKEMGRD